MRCVLCKNEIKECVINESVIIPCAGKIQKLNDNSIMIVCGYGSLFDCNGYSSNNDDILEILENKIGEWVCDCCINKNTENKNLICHEDRYAITQENLNFNLNLG